MNNPFAGGHRQLLDAQTSGLSRAWRAAAEAAARSRPGAPDDGRAANVLQVGWGALALCAAVVAFALIVAVPLSEPDPGPVVVTAPVAPSKVAAEASREQVPGSRQYR
jgi:hypothetical protein